MAGAYTLYVQVQAGVSGLVGGLRTAAGQVTAFGGQVRRLDGDLNGLAARSERTRRAMATGFTVMGVALGGAFVMGVRSAIELEKHMANVMTISQEINNTNIEQFTNQIVDLSTQLPQSADQLAEGLYQIVSTGFDGADAMTILRVAARGAAAGLTTTETSARALLGVLKAYGMDASQANDVMDTMFQTVNYGVVSFDELAQQLGDVVPMAAAAGVTFDDISSALAAVTLSGIPAAEGVTALNMLLTRMMKPTQELSAMIKGFGYESASAALQQDGLYVVMQKVRNATGGSADQLVPLLRDIRAVRAALALSAADGENYATVYQGISQEVQRAGATQKAYAIQMDTTAGQWSLFRNQAQALGIDMARVLLPALQTAGEFLNVLAGAVNDLPGPVKSLMGVLIALSAVAMLGKAAFLRFGAQLTAFRTELAAARAGGSALPAVLSGAGIAVGALTALMAVGVGVYAAYSASKQKAKAATDELVDALRKERDEGEQGAGLRTLTEQLTNSDDVKKLKDAGVDVATAIDAITSGGQKLRQLKEELASAKAASWEVAGGTYTYDISFDRAKGVLDKQHKIWSNAVKKESDLAANMAIVNNKIEHNRRELLGAWDLTQSLPTDKTGSPQFTDQMEAMGKSLASIVDPAKAWKAAQDKVAEANRQAGRSADVSKASLSDYVQELQKQLKAQREFQKNLGELASEGRLDLADHFSDLGPDSAPLLDELVKQLQHGKGKVADELESIIRESSARATPAFRAGMEQLPAISAKYGKKTAEAWADASATNDPGKLARVMRDMTVADMSNAAKRLPKAAAAQLEQGMSLLADVSAKFGKEASTSLAQSFLKGDVEDIRTQLGYLYGADMPIEAPDLSGVTGAFKAAGIQSNAEWSGMLSLIVAVSQTKGTAAAAALTSALLSGNMAAVKNQLDAIGASVGRIPGSKNIAISVSKPPSVNIPVYFAYKNAPYSPTGTHGPYANGYQGLAEADGGVVSYYANGGVRKGTEQHIAQIARGGSWRVWGEDETQGEGYVPLAVSKRPRSRAITEEIVRRLGGDPAGIEWNAQGGVTDWTYDPATGSLYSSSDAGDAGHKTKKVKKRVKGKNGKWTTKVTEVDYFDEGAVERKLKANSRANQVWAKDLSTVADRAGADVADALASMGEDGIALTKKMARGSKKYVDEMAKELRGLAAEAKASLTDYVRQLNKATGADDAFARNLATLAGKGYGDLAKQLAAQDDQAAMELAAAAVKDNKKASAANSAAKRANTALTSDQVADLVSIIAAVKSSRTGLHDVAETTGLDEDSVIETATKGLGQIKRALGGRGDRFVSDLSRANRGLSYANGGILTPGLYATSNGLVRFAEPQTSGEAFIPLGGAQRDSATAVLRDVAGRFGYHLTSRGVSGPSRLVDARPAAGVQVVVVREQPAALVGSMPVTVTGGADRDTADTVGFEIMRRLRNAQRGGRI
ncbi:phage tail tape measure protein [Streptomyces sp. NBC_01197]|uniref:phage tail tape measure protein n=1 Tax=Streptomyces sp. NBC_01197 TaxID=2903768 RepID=UPI002E14264F|nr:phage tail tape measure protein [Streptomyces sp. NBC_01197]